MALSQVEGSNALLEGQKRLVDLSTVQPGLFVGVLDVGASLASSEVDKTQFSVDLVIVVSEDNLEDSVTP